MYPHSKPHLHLQNCLIDSRYFLTQNCSRWKIYQIIHHTYLWLNQKENCKYCKLYLDMTGNCPLPIISRTHNQGRYSHNQGRYSVQKTLQGRAANMGSKISLLVYKWHLIKCRSWYMNGSIFKILPNLSFAAACPYQNQTSVTPPTHRMWGFHNSYTISQAFRTWKGVCAKINIC